MNKNSGLSLSPEEIAANAGILAALQAATKKNSQVKPRQVLKNRAAPVFTDKDFEIPCKYCPPKNLSMTFLQFLNTVNAASTNAQKDSIINAYTQEVLQKNGRWPLVDTDKVTANFIYRSELSLEPGFVALPSEWNGWGGSYFTVENGVMTRISLGGEFPDLFYFIYKFEKDARLDYKIVDDGNWLWDPLNPLASPGGFGGNPTVVMPKYCPSQYAKYSSCIKHGKVIGAGGQLTPLAGSPIGGNPSIDPNNMNKALDINSAVPFVIKNALKNLYVGGVTRDQSYWVYLPHGYDCHSSKRYPTLYFGDGNDYLQYGYVNNILDMLISKGKIPPVIAVFHNQDYCQTFTGNPCSWPTSAPDFTYWDARGNDTHSISKYDPADSSVKFNPFQEYLENFLVPTIDSNYRTIPKSKHRVVIGDSSLASMAFNAGLNTSNVFGKVLAQSLLYPEINALYPELDINDQAYLDSINGPTLYRNDYIPGTDQDLLNYIGSFYPISKNVDFYINWGTYEKFQFGISTLTNYNIVDYMKSKGWCVKQHPSHTGHSWSQWPIDVQKGLPKLLKK